MTSTVHDLVVVGAGIAGSSTAYQFCKNKSSHQSCLLLEQFELLHNKGSSHGNSRITRYNYTDPVYARMGVLCLEMWKSAQKESKMQVYHQTGGIDIGEKNDKNILSIINSAKLVGYDITILRGKKQIKERFPLLNAPDNCVVLYEKNAGILNAEEAVRMLIWLAAKHGCQVHEQEKFLSFKVLDNGLVKVQTSKATYLTKKLALTTGAWTAKTTALPLQFNVTKMSYAHWKVKPEYHELWKKMPVWISYDESDGDLGAYGFPMFEPEVKGHVKSALHTPLLSECNVDPDNRDFDMSLEKMAKIKSYICKHFNPDCFDFEDFETMKKQGKTFTCLYTNTESTDFVIDTHPSCKNIVVFSGGSGHAFKFGPILGRMLCELIHNPDTKNLLGEFDRAKWKIQRVMKSASYASKL